MAKIVISTAGTLGDHLPYIALGKSLQARGHQVCLAISHSFHDYAIKAGLEVVSCGRSHGKQEAQQDAKTWNQLEKGIISNRLISDPDVYEQMLRFIEKAFPSILETLLKICADADLLICGAQYLTLGAFVAEKLDIPWVGTSLMPFLQCQNSHQNTQHSAVDRRDPYLLKINELRQQFALKAFTQAEWFDYSEKHPQKAILAASSHFSQLNAESQQYQQTGFWFYEDSDWQNWQPDTQLRDFFASDRKPLVLSFSSLPLENAKAVLEVHVCAAAKLNRRLLIQQGWADFNESLLPENCDRHMIMFAGFMPQDWLFANAAALIHHGGIGTIARAIRNDCPMLVEPYGNDQFFNAKQILSLKIGAAMHPHRITADGLAHILQTKVLSDECKQNVQAIDAKIRKENGLETASNLIESWL
jgi:UDP:flavonoid glycosyltransferase YjiC (YdhE family)